MAIFPLLKLLKSFLYYVANSTMSLRQVPNKAFCLLVACPPLTLMSRTHPTDTTDRTGQVLPTATHCAISYRSRLFQGTEQPTWTEIAFPHVLHTACTTALSENRIKPNSEHTHVGTLPMFIYQNAELSAKIPGTERPPLCAP